MMGLIAKVVRTPEGVGPEDIQSVRDAGASDDAIRDALYIATIFNLLARVADALGWRISSASSFQRVAKHLLPNGYKFDPPLRLAALAMRLVPWRPR